MIPERGTWEYQEWLEAQLDAALDQIADLREELREVRHEEPRRAQRELQAAELWIDELLARIGRAELRAEVCWQLYRSAVEELRKVKGELPRGH